MTKIDTTASHQKDNRLLQRYNFNLQSPTIDITFEGDVKHLVGLFGISPTGGFKVFPPSYGI